MSGAVKWSRSIPGAGPIEANGRIYCFASRQDILVLDMKTGSTLAYYPVGKPGYFNTPIVVGDRIIVAAQNMIYCLADITD
jgi:outer membrane protein assembly factor BamB